jgi:small-conductance mechanosensitive channel
MGQKGKFLLGKVSHNHFWKNNLNFQNDYTNVYFTQLILKKFIDFFFLYSINICLLKKKNSLRKNLYLSQIWLNSFANYIIISFNIKCKYRKLRKRKLLDNFIRLKYYYHALNKKRYF